MDGPSGKRACGARWCTSKAGCINKRWKWQKPLPLLLEVLGPY